MEQTNKINAYVCFNLHITVTKNVDEGVTPMFIACPKCFKQAISMMYNVNQSSKPTQQWYKPTRDEIVAEAKAVTKNFNVSFLDVFNNLQDHVSKGGLLMKELKQ
jgi:hypothetical protein